MKFLATYAYATLGLLGTAIVGAAGCTTTINGGDGGPDLFADSGSDTGAVVDDSGTVSDAGPTADAAGCGAISFGTETCDTCVQAHCCNELIACDTADSTGLDDAGLTGCEQILSCAIAYCATPAADGGAMTFGQDCLDTCNGSYTEAQKTGSSALVTCTQTNCATECSGQ